MELPFPRIFEIDGTTGCTRRAITIPSFGMGSGPVSPSTWQWPIRQEKAALNGSILRPTTDRLD